MTVDELKACPFCGGEAEMDTRQGYLNMSTGRPGTAIAIYCTKCGVQQTMCRGDVPDAEPEMVVALWNTRPQQPKPDEGWRASPTKIEPMDRCAACGAYMVEHSYRYLEGPYFCPGGTGTFVAAPKPDEGWLPIESAPKDGAMILACSINHSAVEVVGWQDGLPSGSQLDADEPEEGWVNRDQFYANPRWFTHWRPLPAAPKPDRAGGV